MQFQSCASLMDFSSYLYQYIGTECDLHCSIFTGYIFFSAFNTCLSTTSGLFLLPWNSAKTWKWFYQRDSNPRPSGYEPDELTNCSMVGYIWYREVDLNHQHRLSKSRASANWTIAAFIIPSRLGTAPIFLYYLLTKQSYSNLAFR